MKSRIELQEEAMQNLTELLKENLENMTIPKQMQIDTDISKRAMSDVLFKWKPIPQTTKDKEAYAHAIGDATDRLVGFFPPSRVGTMLLKNFLFDMADKAGWQYVNSFIEEAMREGVHYEYWYGYYVKQINDFILRMITAVTGKGIGKSVPKDEISQELQEMYENIVLEDGEIILYEEV